MKREESLERRGRGRVAGGKLPDDDIVLLKGPCVFSLPAEGIGTDEQDLRLVLGIARQRNLGDPEDSRVIPFLRGDPQGSERGHHPPSSRLLG